MTPAAGRALQKSFELRRAGLADPDERADEEFLSTLRVLAQVDGAVTFGPPRPLTPAEKDLARAGGSRMR